MIDSIKITSLTNIGANIAYNTVFPLVNLAGTPVTQKGNLQIIGNLILNGAGGQYFPPVAQAVLAQTVTNSAQPNITSVGTLTSLNMGGDANLGSVSNVTILGGVNGQYLQTDGTGNLVWVAGGGSGNGVVGGANTQIQFNNNGSFGGAAGLVWAAGNTTLVSTNIAAGTVKTDNYQYANGATFNGTYSNANVAAYLPTYTGNMNANRYTGDGSGLSNITVQFANVANSVAVANVVGIGNIATLSLTGNGAQVLYGNGVITTAYGNANVANYLPTYLGNVGANTIIAAANLTVKANNVGTVQTWTFGTDGALTWPGAGVIDTNANAEFEIRSTSNVVISTDISNVNAHFTFDTTGTFTAPGNVNLLGTRLNVGINAPNVTLNAPTILISDSYNTYIQTAQINNDANGSSDFAAYGTGGDDGQAFVDMGFTGYNYNDPAYTIQPPGTGYVVTQGYANGVGGSLFLGTGENGTVKDIIFGTGGFLAANEFGRIDHANAQFHITSPGAQIKMQDGTLIGPFSGGGPTGLQNGILASPGRELLLATSAPVDGTIGTPSFIVGQDAQWNFNVPGLTNAKGIWSGTGTAADGVICYTTVYGGNNAKFWQDQAHTIAYNLPVGLVGAPGSFIYGSTASDVLISAGEASNANYGISGEVNVTTGNGASTFNWQFGNDGTTVFPVVAYASLPAATTTAGRRAFINNANLVAAGNFGSLVAAGGSNTVPVYSDGSFWRIG